jgi:dCMP deaminase
MTEPLTGDAYFLGIAKAVGAGAKCTRRQVGAIIVDENKHIVATGKNGSPPGHAECTDGACPRGRHYEVQNYVRLTDGDVPIRDMPMVRATTCACGLALPCPNAVAPSSSYDTGKGTCIAVHAEANALLNRTTVSVKGATMYVTDKPCDGCLRLIHGAQISWVVTPSGILNCRLP